MATGGACAVAMLTEPWMECSPAFGIKLNWCALTVYVWLAVLLSEEIEWPVGHCHLDLC